AALVADLFRRCRESGETIVVPEFPAQMEPDAPLRYYRWTVTPLRDADGRVATLLAIAIEITEAVEGRQKVESLAAAEVEGRERWQRTVESMADMVAVCNAEGRVTYVNPALEAILVRGADPSIPREATAETWGL